MIVLKCGRQTGNDREGVFEHYATRERSAGITKRSRLKKNSLSAQTYTPEKATMNEELLKTSYEQECQTHLADLHERLKISARSRP